MFSIVQIPRNYGIVCILTSQCEMAQPEFIKYGRLYFLWQVANYEGETHIILSQGCSLTGGNIHPLSLLALPLTEKKTGLICTSAALGRELYLSCMGIVKHGKQQTLPSSYSSRIINDSNSTWSELSQYKGSIMNIWHVELHKIDVQSLIKIHCVVLQTFPVPVGSGYPLHSPILSQEADLFAAYNRALLCSHCDDSLLISDCIL